MYLVSEAEFRLMFRLSRTVFKVLVVQISPWITRRRSNNGNQNVTAEAKIAISLYFMAQQLQRVERDRAGSAQPQPTSASGDRAISPRGDLSAAIGSATIAIGAGAAAAERQ